MCVPAAVLAAVTTVASTIMSNRQQNKTPQIARNEVPLPKTAGPRAQGGLDPEELKGKDEELKVGTTAKQQRDRKRAREGLKTLAAVDPPQGQLPSAPSQGITT